MKLSVPMSCDSLYPVLGTPGALASTVTTGVQVVGGGSGALLFAAIGFLWVRYGIPRISRRLTESSDWYNRRYVKVCNYGLFGLVAVAGFVSVVVGMVAWATGTTFH